MKGVCQDRNTTGFSDDLDTVLRLYIFPWDKVGTSGIEIFFEGFIWDLYDLMLHKISGKVRSGDHSIRISHGKLLVGDGDAVGVEAAYHFFVAFQTAPDQKLCHILKGFVAVINKKSHDMDILFFVCNGKFCAGNYLDRQGECGGGVHGFLHAGYSVVVSQCHSTKSFLCGKPDDFSGCAGAIGSI